MDNDNLTQLFVSVPGISDDLRYEVTVNEVNLTESLAMPGLVTSAIVQSTLNTVREGWQDVFRPTKNLDEYYAKPMLIHAERPIINTVYGGSLKWDFNTSGVIYRLSNRIKITDQIEQFQLDACDPSLLIDGKTFISKSWFNVTPDTVVRDVLTSTFPSVNADIEEVNPKKDYIAEFLHPFQVINQQADLSVTRTDTLDPSLVHFMTYQNKSGADIPTHNFRSLTKMASGDPIFEFTYNGKFNTDSNYGNPKDIMTYKFPRDFDLLSDLLNGTDFDDGSPFLSMNMLNPLTNNISNFGPTKNKNTPWFEWSNLGTESIQNSSPMSSERTKILRRARMSLIEQNSIALNMVVPFSPFLNAGRTIEVKIFNTKDGSLNYGSGKYLIVNMTHNIKLGGFGTTTVDCVSDSVSRGIA